MKTPDNRPRFGWTKTMDIEPQVIYETYGKRDPLWRPVVVIPLPYVSAKVKKKVREFTNGTLWPRQ
jgi:hypothetical protein